MSKLRNFLARIVPWLAATSVSTAETPDADEALWQETYSAREALFEEHFGPLPQDILKIGHMFGVWPGGGLYVIPAEKLGEGLWVYATFGLTNSDMPTGTTVQDVEADHDEAGRLTRSAGTLTSKEPAITPAGVAGYGYEMLMLAREDAEWPLWFMQWTVNAEILNDAGLLDRVERYDGLTVEQIMISETDSINVLIANAREPVPSTLSLPNGQAQLLIATVITDEEMQWSLDNGRGALLNKLMGAGVGQVSVPGRASVVDQGVD